jgi:hypothetical protein
MKSSKERMRSRLGAGASGSGFGSAAARAGEVVWCACRSIAWMRNVRIYHDA